MDTSAATPGTILVTREIPFPVELVWQAWTDPTQIAEWYGPMGFGVAPGSVTMEARVGGTWSATVVIPQTGDGHHFWGTVREVLEPMRIVYSMNYADDNTLPAETAEDPNAHNITLSIQPSENHQNHSVLTYRQDGLMMPGQVEAAGAGMESYFDSLEQFLQTR